MQARASVLINCPVEMAFTFIADTANDRAWRSHLGSSRGRATAVGDRITQTYSYQGTSKSVELEVSEFEPPERLGYTISKPVRARMSFHCRPDGAGTRVSVAISASLSGPAALFEGRVQAEADKLLAADLDRLKRALERT